MGSDHCPAWVDIKVDDALQQMMDSGPWPVPQLCSSNYPEFWGKQQSLRSFLSVKVSSTSVATSSTNGHHTSHVEMRRVEVVSTSSSSAAAAAAAASTTVRPVRDSDFVEDGPQQDQKSQKQAKLWSFFAGPEGTTPPKREQPFQSARAIVERSNSECHVH